MMWLYHIQTQRHIEFVPHTHLSPPLYKENMRNIYIYVPLTPLPSMLHRQKYMELSNTDLHHIIKQLLSFASNNSTLLSTYHYSSSSSPLSLSHLHLYNPLCNNSSLSLYSNLRKHIYLLLSFSLQKGNAMIAKRARAIFLNQIASKEFL